MESPENVVNWVNNSLFDRDDDEEVMYITTESELVLAAIQLKLYKSDNSIHPNVRDVQILVKADTPDQKETGAFKRYSISEISGKIVDDRGYVVSLSKTMDIYNELAKLVEQQKIK